MQGSRPLPSPRGLRQVQKKRLVTDAKEVGVGNPAEENTFRHRTPNYEHSKCQGHGYSSQRSQFPLGN